MCIKDILHKIRIGFVRLSGNGVPYVDEKKRYGNSGEDRFISTLKSLLPDCEIKRNVMVSSPDGIAEIDCLLLYGNKLFVIEVKNWKGRLIETPNGFIKIKQDNWTDEEHLIPLSSPFRQVKREISILKKSTHCNAWINDVVFFSSNEFGGIRTTTNQVWFSKVGDLVDYIVHSKQPSESADARRLFSMCRSADYILSSFRSLRGIIDSSTFSFNTEHGIISKNMIETVSIKHRWSKDIVSLQLKTGQEYTIECENMKINVYSDGKYQTYSLSKINRIEIGH